MTCSQCSHVRHIILAVQHGEPTQWGALGLSREAGLQWKLLAFSSLGALLTDYREAYRQCGHEVTKVRIGLAMPHDDAYKGKARRRVQLYSNTVWLFAISASTHSSIDTTSHGQVENDHDENNTVYPDVQEALECRSQSASDVSRCDAAQVAWRALKLRMKGSSWAELCTAADQHAQRSAGRTASR